MLMLTSTQISYLQQEGWTRKAIADFKGVNERTIYRWNKRKFDYNYWSHRHGRKWGRKSKLAGEVLKTFLDYISKNNTLTQQEMADYVSQLIGQKITRFIISRTLKKNELVRKKINYHYLEQDKERIEDFQNALYPLLSLPILALDECSFHIGEAPRYGYAKWGSRADSQRTGKKSSNYTLILCISNIGKEGVVIYELIKGGVKAQNFHNFLSNIELTANEKNYLIMDNVRVHHANQACKKAGLTSIKELLVSKNTEPLYLPPYTPEMNPVELCFNFIRHYVEKSKPKTLEELELAIDKIIDMLDEKDLTKYFQHCYDYVPVDKNDKYRLSLTKYL
jgi:transposase